MLDPKFNNCIIYYKSGDGESWIDSIRNLNNKTMDVTELEKDQLEQEYHSIIWEHDHDETDGRGGIKIENGKVIESKYGPASY